MKRPQVAQRAERYGWFGLAVSALLGTCVALLHLSGNPVLERIEGITLDWRFVFRGHEPAPKDVAIVAIDDATLANLGRWPLQRETLAQAIDSLDAAGAKTIAVDILLLERETVGDSGQGISAGDQALVESLRRHGSGIVAMATLFNGSAPTTTSDSVRPLALRAVKRPASGVLQPPTALGILRPLSELEAVAHIGHANLLPDPGGTPRAHYPVIALADEYLPSFPIMAVAAQAGASGADIALSLDGELRLPRAAGEGAQLISLGHELEIPLNYLGPTGTIASYSLIDLRNGKIPPELLRGRVVLLGATATVSGDEFITPFDPGLPGVEVLATAIANLLDDNYLRRPTTQILLEAGLIILLTLLAWGLGQAPEPRLGLGLNLVLLISWLLLSQLVFVAWLRWLAIAGPSLGIILGATIAVTGRMVRERRMRSEAERQRGNLARYVPPRLVDTLADKEGSAFAEREQMAAILFIDLQGFTHDSEGRSPSETAHFLKEFHAQLENGVTAHQGIIAQFLGDGAFVMWGLPQPAEEDPALALECARDMLRRLAVWKPELTARIGVHFGPVAMAQLGGQNQLQLAAAGDTVNVASRLEAIAKEVGAILTVSDDLASAIRALGRHELLFGLAAQPARRVRGRDQLLGYWSAKSVDELS